MELINKAEGIGASKSCEMRYARHIISQLLCLGRHTVTGLMSTAGRQFEDWTADYRLYSNARIDSDKLFDVVFKEIAHKQDDAYGIAVAMDDTLLRKRGKKIPGVKYVRDPLGPPFQVNFVRGQRVIQISAAYKNSSATSATMIPILFRDAPSALKPKKSAPTSAWDAYKEQQKLFNLSKHGVHGLATTRTMLDNYNMNSKRLVVAVDGSYTNSTVLKNLPDRTTLIGRIRSDTKLYFQPHLSALSRGRKKVYGNRAPTPEQLRRDDAVGWTKVNAYAVGKVHEFKIKTIEGVLWRSAGGNHIFRLLVIAPLGYRPNKKSRVLYREAAYLLCSDPSLPVEKLLQYYLDRWDIEVNFRDEKTILGVGQAQVRNEQSVNLVPKMAVAAYAAMLVAGNKLRAEDKSYLPLPKWNRRPSTNRTTTSDYIRKLRSELWGIGIDSLNFSGFMKKNNKVAKPEKFDFPLKSAVLYAYG